MRALYAVHNALWHLHWAGLGKTRRAYTVSLWLLPTVYSLVVPAVNGGALRWPIAVSSVLQALGLHIAART